MNEKKREIQKADIMFLETVEKDLLSLEDHLRILLKRLYEMDNERLMRKKFFYYFEEDK